MDFKQIEAFAAVMEHGSFSKAAQALYLTQPTVSAHVAMLENELGTKLLQRTTKELIPTEAGNIFYGYSKQLLELRVKACNAVSAHVSGENPTVSIATSTVPAQYYLPRLMTEFRNANPVVSFSVMQGDSAFAEDAVLSGSAELGLLGRKPESSRCIAAPFAGDHLVIVTPNTERYRQLGDSFPISLLLTEPYVSRESGSGTRTEVENFMLKAGIDPGQLNTVVKTRTTESVKRLVSQGAGISMISEAAAGDYVEFGKLLKFQPERMSPTRQLYIIKLRNSVLSQWAMEFFNYVKSSGLNEK